MLAEKKKKHRVLFYCQLFTGLNQWYSAIRLLFCPGFYMLQLLQKCEFFLKRYHKSMCKVCATFTLKQQLSNSLHMVAYVY